MLYLLQQHGHKQRSLTTLRSSHHTGVYLMRSILFGLAGIIHSKSTRHQKIDERFTLFRSARKHMHMHGGGTHYEKPTPNHASNRQYRDKGRYDSRVLTRYGASSQNATSIAGVSVSPTVPSKSKRIDMSL